MNGEPIKPQGGGAEVGTTGGRYGSLLDEDLPRPVRKVIEVARELVEKGEKWRAVDLLAHALLSVRQTGVLIARFNNIFIYYESMTGKMHMLKSEMLAKIFEELNITETALSLHRTQEADSIVRRLFRSHVIARRVHFLLKELGWFQTIHDQYFWRKWEDSVSGRAYISIYRKSPSGLVEVYRVPVEGTYISAKGGAVLTREHVKPENEVRMHWRTKGML